MIEGVVVQRPDPDMLGEVSASSTRPCSCLLYTRDSLRAVARIEFAKPTRDGFGCFVRVQELDSILTVPIYAVAHLDKLLQLAGARS